MFVDNGNQNRQHGNNNGQIIGFISILLIIIILPTIITIVNNNKKQITTSNASQNQITMPVETTYTIASSNDIVNEIGGKLIFGNEATSNIIGTGLVPDQSFLALRFTGGVVRLNNPVVSAKIVFTVSQQAQQSKGFTIFNTPTSTIRFNFGIVNSPIGAPFGTTNTPSGLYQQLPPRPVTTINPIDQQDAPFEVDVTKEVTQYMQMPNRSVDVPVVFVFKGYGDSQNRVFIYNTQTPDKAPKLIVTYQFVADNSNPRP